MTYKRTLTHVISAGLLCLLSARSMHAADDSYDPVKQVTATFPNSIVFKHKGRLLEFCPDSTCHGFLASTDASAATLKDFAYLYIYFFSDYYALPEWRLKDAPRNVADHLLAKPEYRGCEKENRRETARCVLLELAKNGKIKVLFIRYDEGQRNVVRENIAGQLSEKRPVSKQQ